MLKNKTGLECLIGDKVYHFTCDTDSTLSHIKESLFQFMKYIGQIEDAHAKAQAEIKEKIKVEEPQKE